VIEAGAGVAGGDLIEHGLHYLPQGLARLASERSCCFTLEKTFSIGFRSGLQGGKYQAVAPADAISSRACGRLWLERLSITTTSPGRNAGTST
jgi:hypothetical protein